ncbi:MAG TPA: hypothetical protein DD381_05620 [Lentisphaeria bacterium]|nr:MAG: hypothetical protein A2X47_08485 [Lentisphaerae bacterium GWF2_38_69]HBM15805.1 hypothetical protein [Lentisphaeria bacterium]
MKKLYLPYFILQFYLIAFYLFSDDNKEYKIIEGYLYIGFEQNEFRPFKTTDVWWINSDRTALAEYSFLVAADNIDSHSIQCKIEGYLSPKKTPGYGHFSAYKREFKLISIKNISYSHEYILKKYKGCEVIPDSLLSNYTELVTALRLCDKSRVESLIGKEKITLTDTDRATAASDYGTDINLNFLKNNFQPQILIVRRDSENDFLLRTATTAFWFKKDSKGKWKLVNYLDKPIQ